MKGKLLGLAAVAALAIGFASSGAQAQSSKFAATYSDTTKFVKAEISSDGDGIVTGPFCTGSSGKSGVGSEASPCILAVAQLATIDVAQQKDLLIGVSAQIGLVTFTQAKGKSADSPTLGSATAEGAVAVTLAIFNEGDDPFTATPVQVAAPGPVIFASRLQELKVGVNADLED